MHEAAVCREIMDVAGKAAEDGGLTKVCEIVIAAGPYSCIQENQLNFYFNIAKTGTGSVRSLDMGENRTRVPII